MPNSELPPVITGIRGRCPQCGEGALFEGFLKFARHCEGCGANFDIEDAGDGPAVFVIFIAGFVIIPLALAFQLLSGASTLVTLLIWVPILIVFCLALMRPLRGIMFCLQWKNKARQVSAKDIEP